MLYGKIRMDKKCTIKKKICLRHRKNLWVFITADLLKFGVTTFTQYTLIYLCCIIVAVIPDLHISCSYDFVSAPQSKHPKFMWLTLAYFLPVHTIVKLILLRWKWKYHCSFLNTVLFLYFYHEFQQYYPLLIYNEE